jgi:hypothetical protein
MKLYINLLFNYLYQFYQRVQAGGEENVTVANDHQPRLIAGESVVQRVVEEVLVGVRRARQVASPPHLAGAKPVVNWRVTTNDRAV